MLTDCLGLNCKKCVKLQKKKISSLDRLSCNYKLNSREMFFYCDKNRNLSLQSIMKKLMKTHIKVQKCKLSVTFTKAVGRTGVFAASPGPYVWHLWSKGWRWCKARIHIQQAGLPTRIRISSNKRWALFFIGCQAGLFFCQCFSVTEPLSGCCIRPPQRSVGVLRTRRRRNENQTLLCGVFSSWTQSSRCDTHKLLENFKLFGNYSSWRRRGCVVPKNKKCLQFSWWRACSSPSAPGSWNVCVPLAFQHFQLFAGF